MLLQQEREERAKHVTADGGVRRMKDRARIEDGLALAEELLNLQQLAVSQYGLQWAHIGIGAQHEDTIQARLLGELAGIDLERPLPPRFAAFAQIASVGGV